MHRSLGEDVEGSPGSEAVGGRQVSERQALRLGFLCPQRRARERKGTSPLLVCLREGGKELQPIFLGLSLSAESVQRNCLDLQAV